MSEVAVGNSVRADMHDGEIKGEVTDVNNRKVTIDGDEKHVSENGQELVMETDETVTVFDRNINAIDD